MKMLELPAGADLMRLYHGFSDDFNYFVTTDLWTSVLTDTGTATVSDGGVGGILAITPSDGTVADNDEAYVSQTTETFIVAADKPIIVEALIQFTEGATDDANIMFGLKDAWAANSLLDDGGGPAASYSGAVFFKVDGDTTWRVENSVAGTQKTTELDADGSLDGVAKTAGTAALYQTLRIEIRPHSSTLADYLFFIDGVLVAKHKDQVYTSFTAAEVGFGIKNGAITTVETLNVDYVFAYQKR